MSNYVVFVLAFFLSSCTPYAEVGMGYRIHSNLYGTSPTVDVEVGLKSDNVSCGFRHFSSLRSGPPFNNDWEAAEDSFRCSVRTK